MLKDENFEPLIKEILNKKLWFPSDLIDNEQSKYSIRTIKSGEFIMSFKNIKLIINSRWSYKNSIYCWIEILWN